MSTIVSAPLNYVIRDDTPCLFLSGSLEGGDRIEGWQTCVIQALQDIDNLIILDPRRPDWTAGLHQGVASPCFCQQVEWELEGLRRAHWVAINFVADTMSPITLLELGLAAASTNSKAIVCCPESYWRRGNVEITCKRYNVPFYESFEDFLLALRKAVDEWVPYTSKW